MMLILLAVLLATSGVYAIWYFRIRQRATEDTIPILEAPVHRWTTEFLQSKRHRTDPVADGVISLIMAHGEKAQVNQLFGMITDDNEQLPENVHPEIRNYFEKTAILPSWADPDLIALGQQIYIRHGVLISLLLSYKSLPETYACAKGAMVLFHTARLNEQNGSMDTYSRRIAETAQFILFAMSPDGLSPEGRGIRAAQKVRLIHAVIRFYLRQQNWDVTQFDEPINQEDMAGTLMAFSALILEGLELIKVEMTDVEKEAFMHCWRVIGHLMGVEEDLIPANVADGLALGHAIFDHQMAPSEQGKSLMKALLVFQQKISPPFISEETNIEMMRFMMGKSIADMLDVPSADNQDVEKLANTVRFIAEIGETLDHTLLMAMLMQGISKLVLEAQIRWMAKDNVINFYIPESLKKDWGVNTDS